MERKENKLKYGIVFVNDTNVIERLVTNINQNIQFVDVNNWKVYEHYEINNRKTMRELGVLDSNFHFTSFTNSSFEERRSNFQGYLIKTMTGHSRPKILVDKSSAILDIKSQTYDVTKSVEGYHMEILHDMQKYLNFSSTLHEREDGIWGSIVTLDNGTIVPEGMMESVTSGFAEMIVTE